LDKLLSILPSFVTHAPLLFSFCFLILFGFTLPICEEIAVALVGVTMRATNTGFLPMACDALLAILIQDACYFFIARVFGPKLLRHKLFAKFIKSSSIESGARYFKRR